MKKKTAKMRRGISSHTCCFVAGGIFHGGDDEITQLAFKNTVERINARSGFYQLKPIVMVVPRADTYKAQKFGRGFEKVVIYKFDL